MTNFRSLIVLLIGLITVIFLYMWTRLEGPLSDFGLNGFTESLGIGITVLLIDFLQKKREEMRLLPQRLVAYEDVRLLVARIYTFWNSAYLQSVPETPPSSIDELLSKSYINKIYMYLNMDAQANVTPSRTWWDHLPQQLREFKRLAEVILERHHGILDPTVYCGVHQLAHAAMDPDISNAIRASDIEYRFPRPRNLGSYSIIVDEYFPSVLALVDWCITEADIIEKLSGKSPIKIEKQLSSVRPAGTPPCMIQPDALVSQINIMNEHRARSAEGAEGP